MAEDEHQRHRRIRNYKQMGDDARCVSASNLDYSGKIYSMNHRSDITMLQQQRLSQHRLRQQRRQSWRDSTGGADRLSFLSNVGSSGAFDTSWVESNSSSRPNLASSERLSSCKKQHPGSNSLNIIIGNKAFNSSQHIESPLDSKPQHLNDSLSVPTLVVQPPSPEDQTNGLYPTSNSQFSSPMLAHNPSSRHKNLHMTPIAEDPQGSEDCLPGKTVMQCGSTATYTNTTGNVESAKMYADKEDLSEHVTMSSDYFNGKTQHISETDPLLHEAADVIQLNDVTLTPQGEVISDVGAVCRTSGITPLFHPSETDSLTPDRTPVDVGDYTVFTAL